MASGKDLVKEMRQFSFEIDAKWNNPVRWKLFITMHVASGAVINNISNKCQPHNGKPFKI